MTSDSVISGRRLLLVHAHPDDESIGTGATMARYAAEGAQVTLVTCTLGELGEIIPPSLSYLAEGDGGRLGEYRIGELNAACAELGVTDHRFLGGPGRWRDSGMMGTAGNDDPRCFWRADVDEAADALLGVIREVRPQVLVTYDANGFYGHPDHIQAHRVAMRAFQQAGRLRPRQVLRHRGTGFRPRSPPRSTPPPTWTPSWRRCARTPPRSPWTPRSSRCPTASGTRRSAWSATRCWPARAAPPALRAPAGARRTCLRSSLLAWRYLLA